MAYDTLEKAKVDKFNKSVLTMIIYATYVYNSASTYCNKST
jgi:hypothetical protein